MFHQLLLFYLIIPIFWYDGPIMRDTIKKHSDFAMDDTDQLARSAGFLIRARPTIFPNDARYGLIVTKRTFRHAVDRNRAKRLLRAWLHHCERALDPTKDYVFIARPTILTWTRNDGIGAMKKALRYLQKTDVKH